MKKRIVSLVLALVMIAGLLPAGWAAAAELPKLDTPTELTWGVNYWETVNESTGEMELVRQEVPGFISFAPAN